MKKITTAIMLLVTLAAVTTISSCTKTCDTGFSGSDCKTQWNTSFAGTYPSSGLTDNTHYASDNSDSVYHYTLVVAASVSSPTALTFTNFGGFGGTVTASGAATSATDFTLTPGSIATGLTLTSGSGSIANNTLTFTYVTTDAAGAATSHVVATR